MRIAFAIMGSVCFFAEVSNNSDKLLSPRRIDQAITAPEDCAS
jgi:hypothetical protein